VTAELEEVQFACSQHHIIPGSSASSTDHGGSSKSGGTPEEHIYEEPPEEVRMYNMEKHMYQIGLDSLLANYYASSICKPPFFNGPIAASFLSISKKAIMIIVLLCLKLNCVYNVPVSHFSSKAQVIVKTLSMILWKRCTLDDLWPAWRTDHQRLGGEYN
jgi:hypothetical protein